METSKNDYTDRKRNSWRDSLFWPLVALSTLLIICMFCATLMIRDKNNLLDARLKVVNECNSQLEEYGMSAKELKQLRDRLKGIKDQDDLLKRDIQLYIDTKYPTIPSILSTEISNNVVDLSQEHNVSAELVVGMIQVESSFNPMLISKANARGLMQVMPAWAKEFNLDEVCDLHDINVGIESGIRVLKIHISENEGDLHKGLFDYVNGDKTYPEKVYNAMGRFVAFRSTVDDITKTDETEAEIIEIKEEVETNENDTVDESAEPSVVEPPEPIIE